MHGINGWLAQPIIATSISGLGLLLLVLVLLSVPGPIQGLYWFQMDSPTGGGEQLRAGLTGWCWAGTSNCTYAALSDNNYLANNFDVTLAYTVKMMVPAVCYWSIAVIIAWVSLTVTAPAGYRVHGIQYLARHLYFNIMEVGVLCMQLFACVLAWMAYGFTQQAYSSIDKSNIVVKSGTVMQMVAIAATIAMIGFAMGAYALHLRIRESDAVWKEECASLTGPPIEHSEKGIEGGKRDSGVIGNFRASRASMTEWEYGTAKRMSRPPQAAYGNTKAQGVYGSGAPIEVEERVLSRSDLGPDGDSSIEPTQKHTMRPRSLTMSEGV